MRWLIGTAAGFFAGIAILAAVYGVNKTLDWHEHRIVTQANLAVLESDPGYPNREANIRSEREQIAILDREAWKNALAGSIALLIAIGAFVPLWRRAARSFGAVQLAVLVAVSAGVLMSVLGLAVVMLSAGAIRG